MLLAAEAPQAAEQFDAAFLIGIAVAFMAVAIGLFFLEILIPSFGLITLMGIGCVTAALIAAFSAGTAVGIGFIAATAVALPLSIYLAIGVAKRTSLVLGSGEAAGAEGSEAAAGVEEGLKPGARGVAVTLLRPSGTASFDRHKVSVVTSGEVVERGEQVEVVSVDGTRTVVRSVRA